MPIKSRVRASLAAAFALCAAAPAYASGVCGVFLIDNSGSISDGNTVMRDDGFTDYFPAYDPARDERRIQKQGYIDAFNSRAVQDAIFGSDGTRQGAFSFMEYAGSPRDFTPGTHGKGWSVIDKRTFASSGFIKQLETAKFHDHYARSTSVVWALTKAIERLLECPIRNPDKRFIDVSGDGVESALTGWLKKKPPYLTAEDPDFAPVIRPAMERIVRQVAEHSIQINGLILPGDTDQPSQDVRKFYETYIQRGEGAKTYEARSWQDFPAILEQKLVNEIMLLSALPPPRPGT